MAISQTSWYSSPGEIVISWKQGQDPIENDGYTVTHAFTQPGRV